MIDEGGGGGGGGGDCENEVSGADDVEPAKIRGRNSSFQFVE